MRPRSDLRTSVHRAAAEFGEGGVTSRALAQGLGVDAVLVRHTVENMVACGELVVVGRCRESGSYRPVNLYAPAYADPMRCVQQAMAVWAQAA